MPIERILSLPYPDAIEDGPVKDYLLALRDALISDSALSPEDLEKRLGQSVHAHPYEGTITAGTTAQYWRGDKTWQTLNQAAVATFFGTRETKTLGTEYTAASAGLAVAYGSSNDNTYYGFIGYTGTASADTLRIQASADYDSDSDPVLAGRLASITMPVANGEKWKVDYVGTGSGVLYWIPIGA